MTAPAAAQPLKLEVGKSYRTRDGRKVTARNRTDLGTYAVYEDGGEYGAFCREDGKPLDLVGFARWEIIAEWDAPDADGWIQWSGGECPVAPETVVEARSSLGSSFTGIAGLISAKEWLRYVSAYRIVKLASENPKQEPQPMPRDTNIDCLLEAIENSIAAKQIGDAEGASKAAAEFRKYLRKAIRDCAAEQQELVKELAGALELAELWIAEVCEEKASESDRLDLVKIRAALAKAKAAGLV